MSFDDSGISKSQLDKLGSRLRNSTEPADEDLLLLDRYRERFIAVNDEVVGTLRALTGFAIESRHKSVPSIVAKLRRRQPARLSAIQDIAGARIIVPALRDQDDVVNRLVARFSNSEIDDKRQRPTFNYRAVHVVLHSPLPYEIQVRTTMQHDWAQLSERLADRYGFELKYGGGPEEVVAALAEYGDLLAGVELLIADTQAHKLPDADLVGKVTSLAERLPSMVKALTIP